jgi:hypothetical protein
MDTRGLVRDILPDEVKPCRNGNLEKVTWKYQPSDLDAWA